jgi:hypothetical protein
MVEIPKPRPLAGTLAIILLSGYLPACNHPEGAPPPWIRRPDSGRVSLRPIYDGSQARPFVLGGYAGANYVPPVVGRRVMVGQPVPPPQGQPSVTVNQGTWEPE